MQQLLPDLWETEVERPAPGLTTHAYLLLRPHGNILFYNTSRASSWPVIEELGGIAWQLLSHQDEVGGSLRSIRERFGAKLGIHEDEREVAAEFCEPDLLFREPGPLFDGVEVIPTPGHTPGSTCFLVTGQDGLRYLFTGDTLYRAKRGVWRAGMIDGYSNRSQLRSSLRLLQTLSPDVAISSAFTGNAGHQRLDGNEWQQLVGEALAALG
ncbi:MBL fold metallo-hydrolase [Alkalilimnicola ehrlichii]|uniref:MBL fold metallo-hydrolase n=1 Tax=Alkalilimnicola ehrlichii TaxID=351052 RepID=A0A3E0WGJ9_9GAMM|nr:MBL fold metallo-hydrolase [Alkalilimnicola ehrlichii]RFA26600.1 MBL fold metallo-hydrolase [Alkalilimnicola ehrlichii]RFA31878.1 MBL fold metallo-hydrolase [Alkalilimnicola ehrlichii]